MKECETCDKEFQSNWHLRRHMGSMHPNKEFIPIHTKYDRNCSECSDSFTTTQINSLTCGLNKCAVAAYRKRHPERVKANNARRRRTDEHRAKNNAYQNMRNQIPEVKAKASKRRKEKYANGGLQKQQELADKKFGKPPMVNCAECGKGFQLARRIRKGGDNQQKYCGKSCKYRHDNRKIRGTPIGHMIDIVRRSVNHYLGKYRTSKGGKSFALLGYSPMDLVKHIESQFTDGMSWDNRSEWHIDHIRPIASFSFDSIDDPDFRECWALENLRPMWAKDNQSKGSKWEEEQMPEDFQ